MSERQLLMPLPANMKARVQTVTSDVYNICNRIREISPDLILVHHEGHERPWVVMEKCADGAERFVSRYKVADGRILDDLRYMLAVPYERRLAEAEKKVERENKARATISEEKLDRMSDAWLKAVQDSQLFDLHFSTSYPLKPKKEKDGGDVR